MKSDSTPTAKTSNDWGMWLLTTALVVNMTGSGLLIYQMRNFSLASERAAESQLAYERTTQERSARQIELGVLSQRRDVLLAEVAGFDKKMELTRQATEEESRAKASLISVLDRARKAEDELAAATKRQEQFTIQIAELQQKESKLQIDVAELTKKRGTLAIEVTDADTTKQNLIEAQGKLRDVQRQLSQADEDAKLFQRRRALASAEVDDLKKQSDTLRKAVADFEVLQQRAAEEQQKLEARRALRTELDRQEQSLRDNIRQWRTDLDKLAKERDALKDSVADLIESQQRATAAKQEATTTKTRVAELQQQEKDLTAAVQSAKGAVEKLRQTEGELRTSVGAQREQLRQLQLDEESLRAKQLQAVTQTQPSKK